MLKKFVNECRFFLTLETKGPLLIKDGNYKKQPENSLDSCFIRGRTVDKSHPQQPVEEDFYIPGTSLRGVIRSHAERIVRTVVEDENNPICCDPFDYDEELKSPKVACSKRVDKQSPTIPYADVCVICKLFGCTGTASRIQVHDSAIIQKGVLSFRDGIGIDRFTGGVSSGANFKNEVLEGYTFQSEIVIRNFELWQLGLLAYVFYDFEQERVTLGFGASKGFGRVKGKIEEILITYFNNKADTQLMDIGDIWEMRNSENQNIYGFVKGGPTEDSLLRLYPNPNELSYRREYIVADIKKFWKICAEAWNKSVEDARFKSIQQMKRSTKQ